MKVNEILTAIRTNLQWTHSILRMLVPSICKSLFLSSWISSEVREANLLIFSWWIFWASSSPKVALSPIPFMMLELLSFETCAPTPFSSEKHCMNLSIKDEHLLWMYAGEYGILVLNQITYTTSSKASDINKIIDMNAC